MLILRIPSIFSGVADVPLLWQQHPSLGVTSFQQSSGWTQRYTCPAVLSCFCQRASTDFLIHEVTILSIKEPPVAISTRIILQRFCSWCQMPPQRLTWNSAKSSSVSVGWRAPVAAVQEGHCNTPGAIKIPRKYPIIYMELRSSSRTLSWCIPQTINKWIARPTGMWGCQIAVLRA